MSQVRNTQNQRRIESRAESRLDTQIDSRDRWQSEAREQQRATRVRGRGPTSHVMRITPPLQHSHSLHGSPALAPDLDSSRSDVASQECCDYSLHRPPPHAGGGPYTLLVWAHYSLDDCTRHDCPEMAVVSLSCGADRYFAERTSIICESLW